MTENELNNAVQACLKDRKNLTLIPYGKLGRRVHQILRGKFHAEPEWIVDNYITETDDKSRQFLFVNPYTHRQRRLFSE